MKESAMNASGNGSSSPINKVFQTVSKLGVQVKDKVTQVLLKREAPENGYHYDEFENEDRSEGLLKLASGPGHGMPSYGSFPSTSRSAEGLLSAYTPLSPSAPVEIDRKLSATNPLNAENYFRDFADSLPSITVDKFSASESSYKSSQFIGYAEPPPSYNLLTVDTSMRPENGPSSGLPTTGINSSYPSPSASPFETNSSDDHEPETFTWKRYVKILVVAAIFLTAAVFITLTNENVLHLIQISASQDNPFAFPMKRVIPFSPWLPLLTVSITGSFGTPELLNSTRERLKVSVHLVDDDTMKTHAISEIWEVPILLAAPNAELTLSHTFSLTNLSKLFVKKHDESFVLLFESTTDMSLPMVLSLKLLPYYIENGALLGGLVVMGLYVLIIFELVNRTLSAMLAAAVAIGILSAFHERPTMEEMVSWLDMETLILLFSMMLMVSILCETGFFNYCAFFMYKVTSGAVWPMITSLCIFTAVVSAFLDNVTTVLLMTPVTIKICEAMRLNPVPVLISVVIFSNIGGAATPVGDPPNVIIANDPDVQKAGINFATFVSHMAIGITIVMVVSYVQLRVTFRSISSLQFEVPYEIAELKREIDVWTRAVSSLSSYSKDESQVKTILETKVLHLKSELKMKKRMGGQSIEGYRQTLAELEESCKIKDWPLLIKCGIVLSGVIILFFAHSLPQLKLSLGWTALLGAVLLMILADKRELDAILVRIEWSTLIFFSALFIVMEAISKLGLLDWIGSQTEAVILHVNPESRTIVAILIILWVSGMASAFVDNIPFTTMMIKIVVRVSSSLHLPLQPLVWALAFGTCLGGNGTLIGASANVVCAGVADQHGYRFSFVEYFKIGFPNMLVSLFVASIYLTACYYMGFY